MEYKTKQNIYFAVAGVLLLLGALLMFVTYMNRNQIIASPFLAYAIQHHMIIMFLVILFAVAFGFFWANVSYREIQKTKEESQSVMDIVFMFLGEDEKAIVNFLVQHEGKTTQAEISRLPHMSRVKAFRSLKKLEDKELITIEAHGKVRKVFLKQNIMHVLQSL